MHDHLTLLWVVVVWFVVGAIASHGSMRTRKAQRQARAQADRMDARAADMTGD